MAFLVWPIELIMVLLRLGFLVSFDKPTCARGLHQRRRSVIAVSQIKNLLGMSIPSSERFFTQVGLLLTVLESIRRATAAISAVEPGDPPFLQGAARAAAATCGLIQRWRSQSHAARRGRHW